MRVRFQEDKGQVYTCQLFLRYKREIFILGVLGFFEDDTIISEDSPRSPKSSEDVRSLPKTSSLPVLFTSKIRDREEGIVIYSFYTWFSFLTWVLVNIFLEIVSSKTATTHIFQSGVRNWPTGVSQREIEVFNPQAWDSRLRRESWQVYKCTLGYLLPYKYIWLFIFIQHTCKVTGDTKVSLIKHHIQYNILVWPINFLKDSYLWLHITSYTYVTSMVNLNQQYN